MKRYRKQAIAASLVALALGMFGALGGNQGALNSTRHDRSALYVATDETPTPEPTPTPDPNMEPGGGSGTGG